MQMNRGANKALYTLLCSFLVSRILSIASNNGNASLKGYLQCCDKEIAGTEQQPRVETKAQFRITKLRAPQRDRVIID